MANAPNTKNYTLGRGSLYYNPLNKTTSLYEGERHLGNATAVTLNVNVDILDHFNTQSGFKAKDKRAVLQVAPQMSFTLDEITEENWSRLVYGEIITVNQITQDDQTFDIVNPVAGYNYNVGWRNVFGNQISHGSVTGGPFQIGETITGGTSGATGDILNFSAADGTIVLDNISGTFQNAETITGGTSSASATTSSAVVAVNGLVVVREKASPTTVLTLNTDFTVNYLTGYVTFTSATTADDETTYEAVFQVGAASYKKINALKNTTQAGKLRFVSDNPEGPQYTILAHSVEIMPDGDTALIGDDWSVMSFVADILKDNTNPDSPFMDVEVVEQSA